MVEGCCLHAAQLHLRQQPHPGGALSGLPACMSADLRPDPSLLWHARLLQQLLQHVV